MLTKLGPYVWIPLPNYDKIWVSVYHSPCAALFSRKAQQLRLCLFWWAQCLHSFFPFSSHCFPSFRPCQVSSQMSLLRFLFLAQELQNSGLPKPAFFCWAWISASRAVSCSCNWNIDHTTGCFIVITSKRGTPLDKYSSKFKCIHVHAFVWTQHVLRQKGKKMQNLKQEWHSKTRSKHMKGSKERCLLGQNTTYKL